MMDANAPQALVDRVVERLRALADPSRIRILLLLRDGPANVTTLVDSLGIAQASVSKHLSVLKGVGLVESHRQGVSRVYRIADEDIFQLCALVCDGVRNHMNLERERIEQLEAMVR